MSRSEVPQLRATAAQVIEAVFEGGSLDNLLPPARESLARDVDAALLQALVFGVLRDYRLLEAIALGLMRRPPRRRDRLLLMLILVGLFQLRSLRVPAHAAIAETVGAAPALNMGWAKGLVNAVLRRYQRTPADPPNPAPAVRYSHPDWLYQALANDWPDSTPAVFIANNAPAPMTLRVNRRRGPREDYAQCLSAAGIEAEQCPHSAVGLTLVQPTPVSALPGFEQGTVSVQDQAAQLAATLLAPSPAAHVLDACAAPGGKTAHLLELYPEIELVALDQARDRVQRVEEALRRLGLRASVVTGDAVEPALWWDGRPFDRILLDAPCSGTGVIRRHPDIKWLRRADDIDRLARKQRCLLDALWPLLRRGGRMVYATCSTLNAENEDIVAGFAAATPDARVLPIAADWGEATAHGRRIAPGSDGMDGFFYALIQRSDDGE